MKRRAFAAAAAAGATALLATMRKFGLQVGEVTLTFTRR